MIRIIFIFFITLGLTGCQNAPEKASPEENSSPSSQEIKTQTSSTQDKVVIQEFFDFACVYCERAVPVMKQLQEKFGKKLEIQHRHYPRRASLSAHIASECARSQNGFDRFYEEVFKKYPVDEDGLRTIAKNQGLNMQHFDTCTQTQIHRDIIDRDKIAAQNYGIQGTPFFVINEDVRIPGLLTIDAYSKVIKRKLGDNQ